MCNCGKVNSSPKTYTYSTVPQTIVDCDISREEIQSVYNKLVCVKEKTTSKLLNIFLGQILTMLNINEYCKYSLEEINIFITNNNC